MRDRAGNRPVPGRMCRRKMMIKRKVTARPIEKRKNMYRLILQVKGDLPETMIKRILEEVFNKKPEETEAVNWKV